MRKLRQTISRMMLPARVWRHRDTFRSFPICFVLSTGRTGTKFLESFFNRFVPGAWALHEPAPDLFDLGVEQFRSGMSADQVAGRLRRTRLPLLREVIRRSKTMYVECNPHATLLIPTLKSVFSNCRIIWMTRDITSYLPSAFNKSPDGKGTMFFYAHNDHRRRLTAWDLPEDPWRRRWARFSRVERIAWWWQKINQVLIDNTRDDPRCLRIRFEDLFNRQRGPDTVGQVLSFLDPAGDTHVDAQQLDAALSKRKNQTQFSLMGPFEDLPADEQARIYDIVAPVAAELGYAVQPQPTRQVHPWRETDSVTQ